MIRFISITLRSKFALVLTLFFLLLLSGTIKNFQQIFPIMKSFGTVHYDVYSNFEIYSLKCCLYRMFEYLSLDCRKLGMKYFQSKGMNFFSHTPLVWCLIKTNRENIQEAKVKYFWSS